MGSELVFRGQQSHSTPNFWGSPLFMPTSFNAEWPHLEEGVFIWVSHAYHLKGAEPQHCPIWGFSIIYVYTLGRRTTKFGAVTYGEGRFRGSATPLHIAQMHRAVCQR